MVIGSDLGFDAYLPDWLRGRIIPMFAGTAGATLFFRVKRLSDRPLLLIF